jgi:hypothetical protein
MPYVRVGRCVHRRNYDGSTGAKIGCSRTVAEAKEYLKAKYAHAPDAKPAKKGKK